MDRRGVSSSKRGAQTRKQRRARGLEIKERDGHWHIIGTVHAQGRAIRVRKSTRYPATRAFLEAAEAERYEIERSVREEGGIAAQPQIYVSVAAEQYLKTRMKRPFGATTVLYIQDIVRRFGLRKLKEVSLVEWQAWVDERTSGLKPETRERFLNTLVAFLNWCAKKPREWCDKPIFDRDNAARNPRRRERRRVQDLSIDLIAFMLDHAAPHLKAQLWTEWSTGARVSSVLHGCRLCDLILAEGREQLTFYDTKNGETVTAHLHPRAVVALKEYIEWRGKLHDREGPLFLTHNRKPYSVRSSGVQNKTAFNAMKRRARRALRQKLMGQARDLRATGSSKECFEVISQLRDAHRLIGRVTQHWFRHLLATNLRGDLRAAMDQGGWIDERSVMSYTIDVPAHRRELINRLEDGTETGVAKRTKKLIRS